MTCRHQQLRGCSSSLSLYLLQLAVALRRSPILYPSASQTADLDSAHLPHTIADATGFSKANLIEVILSGANLSSAHFERASLTNADLREANPMSANLARAFLVGADLRHRTLVGANLAGAFFAEADLQRANLTDGTGLTSVQKEARLLARCKPQLLYLVVTALHAGFRASELRPPTWCAVDFHRRMITVRAGHAMNGESRTVPMNEGLTTTLKAVKLQATDGERVFCSRQGMAYRSFRTTFERAVRLAGIADVTFHDLRHTTASRLVMAGVDLPTVKGLLGHEDIGMTTCYADPSSEHKQAAVEERESVPAILTTAPQADHEHPPQVIEN